MKYDFTTIMDRHGKDAIAVDGIGMAGKPELPDEGFDVIPMWIADMNFPTVPTVQEEIVKRVNHPTFGYFSPSEEYYQSIIDWQNKRNGVTGLLPEHIGYENGVLGGLLSALTAYAAPGDAVLVHSPTYIGFTHCLNNNGFYIVHSPLVKDEDGIWRMNYQDMEAKIKQNHIHVAIFCSPHNPCGRVWQLDEIQKAMEVYERNDVVVISDEIWSDIILEGYKHIPTQSVNAWAHEHVAALYAPSKTFNLAGLVGALSMHALIGAYKPEGHAWLEELREVITSNVNFSVEYIKENFEGVELMSPEGTYMLFIDCEKWCKQHGKTIEEVEKAGYRVGVAWQDGRMFHGPYSIRMNLALPLSRVQEAFKRLDQYVFNAKW